MLASSQRFIVGDDQLKLRRGANLS